jgi:hypothetical protein
MSSPLSKLQSKLQLTLGDSFRGKTWGAPAEMTKSLAGVRARFDTANVSLNERSIGKALLTFRNMNDLPTFIDLKYACFGLGQSVGRDEWCLLGDLERFPAFLKRVDKERPNPRRFRKCYQGLMHSYFSYDIFDNPGEAARTNWQMLKGYLRERLSVALSATNSPTWLKTLSDHQNLISNSPCERYAAALLKGDSSELVTAGEGIGIAQNSWLWQEAMLAHTQAVTRKTDDSEFRALMDPLIRLLDGEDDIELSDSIVARCAAQLLIRYAKSTDRPEHVPLRDLAVNYIGNPWLKRAAWDAYVQNEDARKMVDGWLKRRLITDFFALLSEEGAANPRRLDYWLRFEPVIEDMWFVLGTNARFNQTPDFREMKRRMEGRLHYLGSGTSADNNAFIMRIGSFMVVEFGVTGNACFVFNAGDLKIDPLQKTLRIGQLKSDQHVARLLHSGPWESNFDIWLLPRIGGKSFVESPSRGANKARFTTAASSQGHDAKPGEYEKFAKSHNLRYRDNRSVAGAFWILTDQRNPVVTNKLGQMGFKYLRDKGWWKE